MKQRLYSALVIAAAMFAVVFNSCEKGPTNGNLDNMWQVMTIENLDDGTKTHPEGMYYCIYRELIQLQYPGHKLQTGMLEYKDGILSVDFPLVKPGDLAKWGIPGTTERFEVHLGSSHMTLRSQTVLLELRKF